jgi:hypothetical protein
MPEYPATLYDAIMRPDDQAFLRDAELYRVISSIDGLSIPRLTQRMAETATDDPCDDGKPWGFINEAGKWIQVPKKPLLLAGLGPPPFWVKMAWDEMRRIVHEPEKPPL